MPRSRGWRGTAWFGARRSWREAGLSSLVKSKAWQGFFTPEELEEFKRMEI